MLSGGLTVRADAAPWRARIKFIVYQKAPVSRVLYNNGKGGESLDFAMAAFDEGSEQESFSLSYEDAQILIDDLWKAGLRPTEGAGSAGQMAATTRHLEDMRAIVKKAIQVDLP